jgi:hypothetical protein
MMSKKMKPKENEKDQKKLKRYEDLMFYAILRCVLKKLSFHQTDVLRKGSMWKISFRSCNERFIKCRIREDFVYLLL